MTSESAVQFNTNSRVHMGLVVSDLQRSIAFYRMLLGQAPDKVRPHYAKFEVAEPPLNISLNETGGPTGPNNSIAHFGIQLKAIGPVKEIGQRLAKAGYALTTEENVTCCYAIQTKVWATDPDGNKWEIYVLLDDNGSTHAASASPCCQPEKAVAELGTESSACCSMPGACNCVST
jgi:catechol 2,3-dioxygenase-like lactoylglutathione lyase family enzyme